MRRRLLNALTAGFMIVLIVPAYAQNRDDEPAAADRGGRYVVNREATLYSRPSADARILRTIPPRTIVDVVRVTDQWLEIRSTKPGNPNGFIRRSYASPYEGGRASRGRRVFRKGIFKLSDPVVVRADPDIESPRVTTLPAGSEVRVVGKSGNWYRIESESGNRPPGYIPVISARRVRDIE
jgi:hypothetical protein